ncbi:P-loop containing nucleoside triphosphate hydrolase protein [Ceratobasidium sp. AG-I]|nr:P-loop containing nucleoside triphosphate hydrolase protein [Ceratobasidium sp. AG-I]
MTAQETSPKSTHESDTEEKSSLLDKEPKCQDLKDASKKEENKPRYREHQLGAWTLYFPLTNTWSDSIPTLSIIYALHGLVKSVPVVWQFLRESLSLGPYTFTVYLISSALASLMPSIQLYNNSYILELTERALLNHEDHTKAFGELKYGFIVYLATLVSGWVVRRLEDYTEPVVKQRVELHFEARVLEVRSQLDINTAEDPDIKSRMDQATKNGSNALSILEGLVESIGIFMELAGHLSVLKQVLGSRNDARIFGLLCIARPMANYAFVYRETNPYYAMITNPHWLRMKALNKLGTETQYKKEVLGGGLANYINLQHEKDLKSLGDTSGHYPGQQMRQKRLVSFDDVSAAFASIPLFLFAWGSLRGSNELSLTSLVMMQQTAATFQNTMWRFVAYGAQISNMFKNVVSLFEALDMKPSMVDGDVAYPDEAHRDQKGTAIEFSGVNFAYSAAQNPILKDMSFIISSGQLCVIVGENGCGKSTTLNLITRLYDCKSGNVLIDGRPVSEYKMSSLRAAVSVMYQDYHHLPLTVGENIRLGRPESENAVQDVEEASRLGGAYDFIQKLPLKFNTNIEPHKTGYRAWSLGRSGKDDFKSLIEAQKPTKLSGGEWQRLSLSRTFMKNSDQVRLLCYDEPSASLDPKAEFETFERLRKLRGDKTMIFVTHRFGHLNKHADLILYVKDGSVIEQGTHKELLEQDGEYAKMYKFQSQAFSED